MRVLALVLLPLACACSDPSQHRSGPHDARGDADGDAAPGEDDDADDSGGDELTGDDAPSGDADECITAGPPVTCGNGRYDPQEGCDGALRPSFGGTCEDNSLGAGATACTARCTLDVSSCEDTDYCAGNWFYNDDECDACELMGGAPDPACAAHCGADGICASWFDASIGEWSCEVTCRGHDPDCGVCGNAVVEGNELCDREAFPVFGGSPLDSCEVWGFNGGNLACRSNCVPDFQGCTN